MKHISEDIIGTIDNELEGKTILHCVTSSISCFLAPTISRLLMRHGANVINVLSPEVTKFVSPMIFEWATGNQPIVNIEGKVEHVLYAGLSKYKADLVLVAPSTANTLSKISSGIMDSSVTLIAGTALGNSIPVVLVPAMHAAMFYNPFIKENIQKLEKIGVRVMMPKMEEEKAKIPDEDQIVNEVIKTLTPQDYRGKKVLVTAGPTRAYLDGIRFISNPSTGKMGFSLAFEAWKRGAEVTLIYGATDIEPPKNLTDVEKVEKPEEMTESVVSKLKNEHYEYVILAAAMNDFGVKEPVDAKVKSKDKWQLVLTPIAKLADKIKETDPETTLVLFKAEYKKSDDELTKIAIERLKKANAQYIIANEVSEAKYGFKSNNNRVAIIKQEGLVSWTEGTKNYVAKKILDSLKNNENN